MSEKASCTSASDGILNESPFYWPAFLDAIYSALFWYSMWYNMKLPTYRSSECIGNSEYRAHPSLWFISLQIMAHIIGIVATGMQVQTDS